MRGSSGPWNVGLRPVAGTELGDIVETEHLIKRRHGDEGAVCRSENVVRAEHEDMGFENSLVPEEKANAHLFAVEVHVEVHTWERGEVVSIAFDEFGRNARMP